MSMIPTDVRGVPINVGDTVVYATTGYRGPAHHKFRKVGAIKDGRVYLMLEDQDKVSPTPLNNRLFYHGPENSYPHILVYNDEGSSLV
jgi:hypothetical protein